MEHDRSRLATIPTPFAGHVEARDLRMKPLGSRKEMRLCSPRRLVGAGRAVRVAVAVAARVVELAGEEVRLVG